MIDQQKMDLYIWRYVAISSVVVLVLVILSAICNFFGDKSLSDGVVIALISFVGTVSVSLIVKGIFHNVS